MIDEVDQDGALMLGFDGAINLPQVAQADDQPGLRLNMQQQFDRMQPGTVLVDHCLFWLSWCPPRSKPRMPAARWA